MRQHWRDLLLTHWPISPKMLRPHIPSHLQIDTFGHYAWVGVVIFEIDGIYPRGFSTLSLTPKFSEINVRTYVKYDGKPGVYFLSLDVKHWASLFIAKKWYHLPYHPAQVSIQKKGETFHYNSIRKCETKIPIICKGTYTPLPEVYFPETGTLDYWLTERYCFFSIDKEDNIYCTEIHHPPWPLQKVVTEPCMNSLFSLFHFDLTSVGPISHFSKGVNTLIWSKTKIQSG